MKASVIISAHKPSRYLDEAIQSALRQDFDDYEVILSSDGVNLAWYARNYDIHYVQSEKKGHSHALNRAVEEACGEYIKDHHWDDVMLPNCLADLCSVDADLVYGNAINFYPNGQEKYYTSVPEVTKWVFWPPVKTGIHSAAYVFKRSKFLELGGRDETMMDSEEVDYYMNLLAHGGTFKRVDVPVCRYRVHDDNKTFVYNKEKRLKVQVYLISKYAELFHVL
jgi:glycosyltransferase involved in cell wall biosynthesis